MINTIINKISGIFRLCRTVLYFVPHQDDELLSMGIDICASVNKGNDVHVILCTDGQKVYVRERLSNQEKCLWYKENHAFSLSKDEVVQARDTEFTESCRALGVPKENIHILQNRMIDGNLEVDAAEDMVMQCLQKYGKKSTVCAIYFDNGKTQHKDHKALGKAVYNLRQKGIIRKVRFFREPYCQSPPDVDFLCKKADPEIVWRIYDAVNAYKCWNPANGRYAVGYHSITKEFENLCKKLTTYYFKM